MREHQVLIDRDVCVGCGLCQRDCPAENLGIEEKKAVVRKPRCISCGHCVAICPRGAVSMTGFEEPPYPLEGDTIVDAQKLLAALRARRSMRHFVKKPVEAEVITQILEAGRWTPTAKNAQGVSYTVLQRDLEQAEGVAVALFRKLLPLAGILYPGMKGKRIDPHFFFKGAPVAIVVQSTDKVSASLAASNMALMAESSGLGVLYSGFFTIAANLSPVLRKAFDIKGKDKAVTTLVLGYPQVKYQRTAQKEKPIVRQR